MSKMDCITTDAFDAHAQLKKSAFQSYQYLFKNLGHLSEEMRKTPLKSYRNLGNSKSNASLWKINFKEYLQNLQMILFK